MNRKKFFSMDIMTKEQRRRTMQHIKSTDTSIEVILRKALWNKGIRYRKNSSNIFGRPDISIKKIKLAIFCDSEFWHGKNWQEKKQRIGTNRAYWIAKIEKNIARDLYVNKMLYEQGWIVLRFWETEIKKETDRCVNVIMKTIAEIK